MNARTRESDNLRCKTDGCGNPAIGACTFELLGKAKGRKCNRAVCSSCGGTDGLCPPHRRGFPRRA